MKEQVYREKRLKQDRCRNEVIEGYGALSFKQQKGKKLLFLNRGDSLYDEMFLKSFLTAFDVTCATFNPKPTMNFSDAKLVFMTNPFMFLYKYPSARYLIHRLGHNQIKQVVEREKPDLMVCSYSTTYGYMGARTNFHPFVLITFGSDLLLAPKSSILSGLTKLALSRADLVLVDGSTTEKAAIRLGADEKKILKFTRFDPSIVVQAKNRDSGSSLRSKFGIKDEKKIVLHTRWFEPLYNVETVVKGFALAKEKVPDLVLVLVGSGTLEAKIRHLGMKLNLSDSLYFTGRIPREELIQLYDEADVYVSASLSDSMHGSLMEAICRGTPAIVSDSETNREWIEDGISGQLFDPHSPEELGQKIAMVVSSEKYREMALRARSTLLAKEKNQWQEGKEKMIQRLLEMTTSSHIVR